VNLTSELDSYTNGIRRSLLSNVIQQPVGCTLPEPNHDQHYFTILASY
jgi:hypothetical protein